MSTLLESAYATLLPAFAGLELDGAVLDFLTSGGCSLLLGETRAEYLARSMSAQRQGSESREQFSQLVAQARELAGQDLLIAVDQELGGILRLHRLVPALPSAAEARTLSTQELARQAASVAESARAMGVNLFLAPIVDVVTGENPWLQNRTLGTRAEDVSRVSGAYVNGVQQAGVAAVAKHFPGHPVTPLDPAVEEAIVECSREELQPTLGVFADLIAGGVQAIMVGPALVPALDAREPSSTSATTVGLLRDEMGFTGLIVSDDLDAPGIHRGRSIEATAVASISAGADLLLLSSEAGLDSVARALVEAVEKGEMTEARLLDAARRVRALAAQLASARG
ncbi:glycoside hydrolase family 3 N-terminal domain-containing protein [Pseudomonas nitroreducens]|uniref:glycoside hydrolase family 3 N-terminal domain-containing protein n=1 Tax=Pseudomonas nitroreducens TaxID=46680 RepID=UPI0009FE3DF6|nr:glycoside hydrolase family 3 N-terminal domain-containing protein [Pseudomonas nitroreducens]NMZ61024.1 glycoside hydrolase family 3 protein [Pseudomonas nitroreducens]SNT47062.1 beta-N-acetylhexosaminidase [Pseudomonas nitroreducens]